VYASLSPQFEFCYDLSAVTWSTTSVVTAGSAGIGRIAVLFMFFSFAPVERRGGVSLTNRFAAGNMDPYALLRVTSNEQRSSVAEGKLSSID
jgi:hypothetical protein